MATKLIDLIEDVTQDDLPTNIFTIEDEDPMVILGKLNEVIGWLKELQIDDVESVLEMIAEIKEDIIDLQANKQDKLTQTQLDAVNSGIDSTKVAQIGTNTTNITNLQNNKVDKTSTANQIYGTDSNGNQTTIEYGSTQTNSANKIVQRDANRDVLVPSTPTSNNGATSKLYVNTYNMCPSDTTVTYTTQPAQYVTLMTAPTNGVAYVRYMLSGSGAIGVHLQTSGGQDLVYNTQNWNDSGMHIYNATFVMKKGQKLMCYENAMTYQWGSIIFVKSEEQS